MQPSTNLPAVGSSGDPSQSLATPHKVFDIEHSTVTDDPRAWSSTRKAVTVVLIALAAMTAALAGSIQNPAIQQLESKLNASPSQISWTLSLFILTQGCVPLLWSAASEIIGRKGVYLLSISIFVVASIIVATSKTIELVIAFRCMQGAGSSAVIAIGAATLADLYDPHERGTKLSVFYAAPLLGASLGPLFGGVLTQAFSWPGPFWFLASWAGVNVLSFFFLFKDTFRKERSLTYQTILRERLSHDAASVVAKAHVDVEAKPALSHRSSLTAVVHHPEAGLYTPSNDIPSTPPVAEINLTLKDFNPIKPITMILRRLNNILILIYSGLLFAFGFLTTYCVARTLGSPAYRYDSLYIGLVLLSFGAGNVCGSLLGGRWSDYVLAKMKAASGGDWCPENRIRSMILGMCLLPPSAIGLGWVLHKHLHIAVVCVMLFLSGFFQSFIYSSTVAYVVDANNGRSSTAVACNSAFRGLTAFAAIEIAVPMQDALGDGWTFTVCGGILVAGGCLTLLVMLKGRQWREAAERKEVEGQGEK